MAEPLTGLSVKPGQLWLWTDSRDASSCRSFVVLVIRPVESQSQVPIGRMRWHTSIIHSDYNNSHGVRYQIAPHDDVNYWPDEPHWELLSDV